MQSLAYLPASNGAGNASLMTVQNVRASGASDILVNTVTGAPNKFYACMGAPHTFTDPVTGETITIISEATAVDFAGHLDSGKVVIDAIAPGYTDTRGSLVGDIVVIKPVTEWSNNLFNVLSQSMDDDGKLKAGAANRAINAPQGTLINGQIVRTVATNNITVAIKTLAGADPSAADPVFVRIGNTVRTISAALSITLAAGTNWFGAGASVFGGVDGDFFAYLIWNTNTSAVAIGIAKEPDMITYADRSATNTDYNHLAITGTAPASTDVMEVVGRFNAILGISATFNWSLPATALIINRPIYETRVFSYSSLNGTWYFQQKGAMKELWGVTGGVGTGNQNLTLPVGFFYVLHDIQSNARGGYSNTNQVVSHVEGDSTTTITFLLIITAGTNPNNRISGHVWGA